MEAAGNTAAGAEIPEASSEDDVEAAAVVEEMAASAGSTLSSEQAVSESPTERPEATLSDEDDPERSDESET